MSETAKTVCRQAHNGDKKPVMVYLTAELRQYLEDRKNETGLSMSAYLVIMLRKEMFHANGQFHGEP